MTKGDARNLYMQWLDAAGVGGAPDDAAFVTKFNLMLSPAQIFVASLRDDEKVLTLGEGDVTAAAPGDDHLIDKPSGMRKILRVEGAGLPVPWALTGNQIQIAGYADFPITVGYTKVPDAIASDASDGTVLEVADDLCPLVPLYAAVLATTADDDDRSTSAWLRSIFSEMAQNITTKASGTASEIASVYRMNG